MNILIICLFIAALLPYLSKIPVAICMQRAGGYDNNYPREQQASLTGLGARAAAAHQNSFESLLIFSIAVLAALATNQQSNLINYMAILHIAARLVYHVLYLMNLAGLRSLIWGVATVASFIILAQCL